MKKKKRGGGKKQKTAVTEEQDRGFSTRQDKRGAKGDQSIGGTGDNTPSTRSRFHPGKSVSNLEHQK